MLIHRSAGMQQALEKLQSQEHLCLIYETHDEWRNAVIPFLALGLERGDKCVYILNDHTADEIRRYLRGSGIDVEAVESTGQLVILHETETYMKPGQFDPDKTIEFLTRLAKITQKEGYFCLRATGEMTWPWGVYPDRERLLEYESRLNREFFRQYPCIAMCQYDLRRSDPAVIEGIILTHPLLARGDHIYDNTYYMPTEEYLGENRRQRQIRGWLDSLERDRMNRVVNNVAGHKQAELSVKNSEERFRTLLENAPLGIAILRNGRILFVNQACAQMVGSQDEYDLFYKPVAEYIAPGYRREIIERISRYERGETVPRLLETVGLKKDGSTFPVFVEIVPLDLPDGPASMVFISDITERKIAEEKLRESYAKLEKIFEQTVKSLSSMTEMRDPYTAGHQVRVADLACAIAAEMKMSREQVHAIRTAALVHDIGKAVVPAEILNKPGKLTDLERSFVQAHAQASYDIVKTIEFAWPVAEIVLQHHERLDGSGYPRGLSGDSILKEAMILAVADVIETMASHRPYRPSFPLEQALDEIRQKRGVLYDPDAVDACLRLFEKKARETGR